MSIWAVVETALTGLSVPMAANVFISATGDSLPDEFLTYRLLSGTPTQHADNGEVSRQEHVQVSYYNRDGLGTVPDIDGSMVSAGFTRGPTTELPYNQQTRHFGLALEYFLLTEA